MCQCEAVGSAAIEATIASGATTVDQVTERCGAGGGCGRCWTLIETMLSDTLLPDTAPFGVAA